MEAFAQVREAAEAGDAEAQRRIRVAAEAQDRDALEYLNQPYRFPVRSPIEMLLANALVSEAYGRLTPEAYQDQRDLFVSILRAPQPPGPEAWFRLETLVGIGRYEADILLTEIHAPDRVKLVVECDGHQFHERTKEQAAHDKRRDRELMALGFHVLRFTGSEVWFGAADAAREVLAFLAAELHRRGR
jgi:very-short-patch-repair endonuclease